MNPDLLFYRQILCGALGGLDNYAERAMVRRLILRIDALGAAPQKAIASEQAAYWRAQYTTIMRIILIAAAVIYVVASLKGVL